MTSYEDSKGPPQVRDARIHADAVVSLTLANCSRMADDVGRLFLPDTLKTEWHDGKLAGCYLNGRLLRADGGTHLDGRRGAVVYMAPGFPALAADTPDWVRDLIREHRPRTIAATPTTNGG